ncbi:MAG: M4 family metallopeptidase [Myxococcales bacterium]|jgi:Zn-dependent metalloprotease
MKRTYGILGALAALGIAAGCSEAPASAPQALEKSEARVVGVGPGGLPSFVSGRIAQAPVPASWTDPALDLAPALREITPLFQLSPSELRLGKAWQDELGYGHARFFREVNGLPVIGSELLVHVDAEGTVYAANGEGFGAIAIEPEPKVPEADARAVAVEGSGVREAVASGLVYLVPQLTGQAHLAWEVRVEGRDGDGLLLAERVYVDALSGQAVSRNSLVRPAKNRRVYDARNGSLKRSEGQGPVSDAAVNAAYDNTGITYDCYWSWFQRDSYNGQGARIDSYVHDSMSGNAYWYANTLNFGDADSQMANPATALDVVAHELSHGVVEYTANLAYEFESGALNEAWADILGASCEAYGDGGTPNADTWKIGEDVYTPYTAGDALRYMNNPTLDGISYDFWPERFLTADAPSEYNDMGGVHTNSGIGNLAYYLAVAGGRHPRNKTTINVSGVGLAQASRSFYRALTTYLSSTSSFQSARLATALAANDLYGATVATNIDTAWAAVGVPPTWLSSGDVVAPLSGNVRTRLYFGVEIPAGTTNLSIVTSGVRGDCDIYAKLGSAPTSQSYHYKSESPTTAETITVANPSQGTWYILLQGCQGCAAFSGVQLTVSFDEHSLTPPPKPSLPPPAPSL